MLIKTTTLDDTPPRASEVTDPAVYRHRRELMRWMLGGTAALALAACKGQEARAQTNHAAKTGSRPLAATPSRVEGAMAVDHPTRYEDATSYNNFYEFSVDKDEPVQLAQTLPTAPWQVAVEGLVHKPGRYDLDDLLRLAPMEERIYRLRCVEGWSMVIPWIGYSLSALIQRVQPMGSAKFVEFVTLADQRYMPNVSRRILDWPYVEGLRLDEALHPLTLLAFGMYGEVLPKQNGAPLRLVVPWKYGFKSAKSLVTIRFTEAQPRTAWMKAVPAEYGFYSNVNPDVSHPRWSQATERRIGEGGLLARRRETKMFNGYAEQVGQLYAGMDLKRHF